MRRVGRAVIDIGTNTLLLLIVDAQLRPIADVCRFGRLGQGLDASGRLADEAIARSLEILRDYRAQVDEHRAALTVVATQAVREAANAAAFVHPAEDILGARIEVISGAREAELAFLAVSRTFPELAGTPYLVVDVGGGSTELVATDGTRVTSAVSIPIGAVRLSERHLKHDPPKPAEVRAMMTDIDTRLAALDLPKGVPVVGTAGTATTIAAIAKGLTRHDPERVTGVRVAPMAVEAQLARMLTQTVAERRGTRGIEPQRADVIAGGVAIYARVLQRLDAPVLITCDRGIRWGLAYEAQSDA
jgi:exopolyphosphatase/guanosine-5'-triphosphate,3'-diphosphate pyrophosphatase